MSIPLRWAPGDTCVVREVAVGKIVRIAKGDVLVNVDGSVFWVPLYALGLRLPWLDAQDEVFARAGRA